MKSTYSVSVIATIMYAQAEWQVRFSFPARVEFDEFDSFIEDIECRPSLPSEDDMLAILQDYYFDDEPDIKVSRIYKLSLKEYNQLFHSFYENDEEMFAELADDTQSTWCRNCGAEGSPAEPDCRDQVCTVCNQDAVQSLAISMNVI